MAGINEHNFRLNGFEYRLTYYKNDKPRIFQDEQEFYGSKSELLRNYVIELGMRDTLFKSQTTQQLSTFILNFFSVEKEKIAKKASVVKGTVADSFKSNNNVKTSKEITANQNIKVLFNQLNWEKVKDRNKKKLLIIGCSDSKQLTSSFSLKSNKNYDFGESIKQARMKRLKYYEALLVNSKKSNYFQKKRNNTDVNVDYFQNCSGKSSIRAIELYGSTKSTFYNPKMKKIFQEKIEESNLDILIISGLFGILRYDDFIFDYHLKIGNSKNIWGNTLTNAVRKYITDNKIDNKLVFYCLSNQYLANFGNADMEWKNLWINHVDGRGHLQANDLKDFLNKI